MGRQDPEGRLGDHLRANGKFVLSLVAVLDDELVGQILHTDMIGTDQRLVGLAPLSVLPGRRRSGCHRPARLSPGCVAQALYRRPPGQAHGG